MKLGVGKVIHQHKGYGFYADVTIRVEELSNSGVVCDNDLPREVELAIFLACEFFLRNSEFRGIRLELIDVKTNPVDSDVSLIAIAIYQAICDAFKLSEIKDKLFFDTEKNQSVFSRFL